MNVEVIVDTCVWSTSFRVATPRPEAQELRNLVQADRVLMTGPIRQEILSGLRTEKEFERVRNGIDRFVDIPLTREDFETAARFFNACRSKGIQGSSTDFLTCAVSARRGLLIYTTDRDFLRFSSHIPVSLHRGDDVR